MSAMLSPDTFRRRLLVALELIDPVTNRPAGAAMRVTAKGFAPPTVTRAGQIVWTDPEPPAARTIEIAGVADCGQFAPYPAVTLNIPVRAPGAAPVIHRDTLVPTGLYEPPAGRLALAGMLIDTAAARDPIVGAKLRIWFQSRNAATALDSQYEARSDERGGFVAFAGDLGSDAPMPLKPPASPLPPAPDGSVVAWLAVTVGATTRHSALQPLRQARLLRAPLPLIWADLAATPPAFP